MEYKEKLDQYDFVTGEYIEKYREKYSSLIGSFLISFSSLENEINFAIIQTIHDRSHDMGYIVIEKLTTNNKIDLLYKMYAPLAKWKGGNESKKWNEIKNELVALNQFRNKIVHANWQTLNNKGFVRTKAKPNSNTGFIEFTNELIKPKTIRDQIKIIDKIEVKLDEYLESLE